MLRKFIGKPTESALSYAARFLHRRGITPNLLTITGLVLNFAGAYCYYAGAWAAGGFVVLAAGLFDMLDGAVARAGNAASPLGAFTDSVVDRYSDFIVFGGLLAHFAAAGDLLHTLLVLVVIMGAYQISYIRARAELVIPRCDVGLMERPERIILLGAGSLFGFVVPALWLLAFLTHLTAFYRIYFTFKAGRR
jgi:phosphatidylglycerophosphate synthase